MHSRTYVYTHSTLRLFLIGLAPDFSGPTSIFELLIPKHWHLILLKLNLLNYPSDIKDRIRTCHAHLQIHELDGCNTLMTETYLMSFFPGELLGTLTAVSCANYDTYVTRQKGEMLSSKIHLLFPMVQP